MAFSGGREIESYYKLAIISAVFPEQGNELCSEHLVIERSRARYFQISRLIRSLPISSCGMATTISGAETVKKLSTQGVDITWYISGCKPALKTPSPASLTRHLEILRSVWRDGFPDGAVVKSPPGNAGDTRDVGPSPGLGRSPGGGHGNTLQCSCLGNPMQRGAWWATVHGVTKSRHN